MILIMEQDTPEAEIQKIIREMEEKGFQVDRSRGKTNVILGLIGDTSRLDPRDLMSRPYVKKAVRVHEPYKRVSRAFHPRDTVVDVGGVPVGGKRFVVIAGPCSVETKEEIEGTAAAVKAAGASILRGGAFKPRTSPYSFQGLGEKGLALLSEAAHKEHMPFVTELMSTEEIGLFLKYKVDMIQIGARNMQNYALLKAVGRLSVPVLLKRGLSATIEEWLLAAEYIMAGGNRNVILCERGIRTFETATRNTLDLSAVVAVKKKSHLPVLVDPSHATGHRDMVPPLALAAAAAGADGVMCEVHPDPEHAWSDGAESITPAVFADMMKKLAQIVPVVGRTL